MEQFFLWLNVIALIILASSITSTLQVYLKNKYPWMRYFLLVKLGFLIWMILYSYNYFRMMYISVQERVSENRIIALFALICSGFSVFAFSMFLCTISEKKKLFCLILSLSTSVLFLVTGGIFLFLEMPVLENYLHMVFYLILFLYSLYGLINRKIILHDPSGKTGFIFITITAIFTPLVFLDYVLFHFSFISVAYFPEGAFSLPLYYIILGLWMIIENSISVQSGTNGNPGRIPEDFIIKHNITDREKEIIACLVSGCNNVDIASKLFISLRTVDTHIYNIYRKCGVKNRIALLNEIDSHKALQ